MLEILIRDALGASGAGCAVESLGRTNPALEKRIASDDEFLYLSPGIFLPHLHVDGAVSASRLGDAGVTAWTLAAFGTDFASLRREVSAAEDSPLSRAPGFCGLLLEGPFLALDGATSFGPKAFGAFLDEIALPVSGVVFAPECVEAERFMGLLCERDIEGWVGHTKAGYEVSRAAFAAGAAGVSLPFSSTPAVHHRSPGPIAAAADSRALAEIPVGAAGFTTQMARFLASVFGERALAAFHPASHVGACAPGVFGVDFARSAAGFMGLDAAAFLTRYSDGARVGPDRWVVFDGDLTVLEASGAAEADSQAKGITSV